MSETSAGQRGPVASLVSVAGWARATQRALGRSWVVTPQGTIEPDAASEQGSSPSLGSHTMPRWRRYVPSTVTTAVKDGRSWVRSTRFRIDPDGPWRDDEVTFVWQRHELFQEAGLRLARRLGAPSVLFVPATLVWQAEQWGVSRPGWGRFLERVGEAPALRAADVVACGTDLVAEQAVRIGAPEDRIVITPTGVDLEVFGSDAGSALRTMLGLRDRYVIGWVGSFRRFHALEQVVEAAAEVPGATLLLVGDGPERPRIERLVKERGVRALFTGTVEHHELPKVLAAMDVAVVLAASTPNFHYSPLKLAEYLAAGLAVVAPRVPEIEKRLSDGIDVELVEPGNPAELARALRTLRDDPERRKRLGQAGRQTAERLWTWDEQVHHVLEAINASATPA